MSKHGPKRQAPASDDIGGDDRVLARRDQVTDRPSAPITRERRRTGVSTHPERTPRTSATIGGPGVRPAKGSRIEGNMPCCTLTPEVFTEIVGYVHGGAFRTTAQKASGVPARTFWDWIRVGREQIEEFIEGKIKEVPLQGQLVIALDRAEGQCFVSQNATVLQGTEVDEDGQLIPADIDDRKLRFAWLQRRFAREWAAPTTGVDDETGAPKKIDVTELLFARLQALKDADG